MRKSTGEVSGRVLFNGTPGQELHSLLRRVTGYVTQEDIAKETLTVRETLRFQAELRLDPKTFTPAMRAARVEQVMEQLGISHRADMRIGNEEKRGLSGGEKKRVAIGVRAGHRPVGAVSGRAHQRSRLVQLARRDSPDAEADRNG